MSLQGKSSSFLGSKYFFFSALYFFGFAAFATFSLDFVFYSQSIGFTNTEIGLIHAVKILMGIVFQPLFGMLCDYLRSTRKLLLLMCTAAIFLSFGIPLAPTRFSLLVIDFIYTFAVCAFMPLIDNWISSESMDNANLSYGTIRLWGSIGFAIVATVYGRITMVMDVSTIYYGRAFFFFVLVLFILFNGGEEKAAPAPRMQNEQNKEKPDIKALFIKKEYWLLFVFIFIFCLPVNSAGQFFPRLLLELGSTNQTIALFSTINAIAEIPFFLFVRRLTRKIGPRGLMFTGGIFMIIRLIGFSMAGSIPLLLAANLCFSPYVSLFMPGFIFYSHSIAPKNTRAFTLTSLQGFAMGLAGMLGSFFSGLIVDSMGIRSLYSYGTILCVFGLVFFLFSSHWIRSKPNDTVVQTEQ